VRYTLWVGCSSCKATGHRRVSCTRAHVEQAVRLARRLGYPALLGVALIWAYGTTGGRFEGRAPLAELTEAVDLCQRAGDLWGVASALNGLGDLYRELGDWQQARPPYEEALAGFRELKDRWMTAWTLEGLGRAAQLAVSANIQTSLLGPEAAQRLQQETELAAAVAEYKNIYAASWVRGQTMGLEQAIGFARAGAKVRRTAPAADSTRDSRPV
jgi:tetratricopeptide (TPR) repeat protein